MKRTLTLLLASLLAPPGSLHAADFILADQARGIAPPPSVGFQDAPPRTHDAAVTLAEYIEKLCGARPEVLAGQPKPLPERAIWIGLQPVVTDL